MRFVRMLLAIVLLVSVLSAQAQEVVVVSGKRCIVHTISEDDTLPRLADQYGVTIRQISDVNGYIDATEMEVGMRIYIPCDDNAQKRRCAKHGNNPKEVVQHTVAQGDTLFSLARMYDTSEQMIMALNGFESESDLLAGMTIVVRGELTSEGLDAAQVGADTLACGCVDLLEGVIVDSLLTAVDSIEMANNIRIPTFRRFERGDTLNVSLLLPMHRKGKPANAWVDYYRGTLLALEDLKRQGYSINLAVMDTERSAAKLSGIAASEPFTKSDLIIGPVYAEELQHVLPFAEENNIPIVNPLSDIDASQVSSPVLFQMQADAKYKYAKYAHIFDGSCEINIVYAASNDKDYVADVEAVTDSLPVRRLNLEMGMHGAEFFLRNADGSRGAAVSAEELVLSPKRKAIIIVANHDYHIEKALAAIGAACEKLEPGAGNECYVIGNRKWDALPYVDRTGFFLSEVSMLAPYNSKNTNNEAIKLFESRFLAMYGVLPTPYACRGYDAAMLFCTKMFTGLDKYILLETLTPLATPYKFKFEDGMFVNSEWVNIQYKSNFTVVYD